MNHNVILPDEDFFSIQFLNRQDFFQTDFDGQTYEIIARDDVDNLIGIASDERVYYLDSVPQNDSLRRIYIAKNAETFVKEIQQYYQYGKTHYPDNPTEEFLEEFAAGFQERITALDPDAFCDENALWATIVEEIGYGIL